MRVLYILNAAGGGATQGILELLRNLPRDAYQAFLVIPDQPNARQRDVFSRLAERYFYVPMVWWNWKVDLPWYWRILVWGRGWLQTLGHLRPLWRLCQIIREQKIDIVYTNTVMILDGALAARLCGVPHIWHIKEWIGMQARVRFLLPDAFLVRLIAGLSARVIVMTRFTGDIFVRHGITQKLKVIYDGVNLADFETAHPGIALREKLGIPSGQFLVGMSASLSSTWKRHDVFIKMAALLAQRLPDVSFVAFGAEPQRHRNPAYNRPWQYYQSLREMVKVLGLEKRFYWAGFSENIPAMMDIMDVLVHPCEIEPFGRVAIEAMAASRPVVGPRQGGIAESVLDQETGLLVNAGDPQSFADAVITLQADPQLRVRMGAQGRIRAIRTFSIQKHLAEISQVYALAQKR